MKIALLNLSSAPNDALAIIASAVRLALIDACTAWGKAPAEIAFMTGAKIAPIGWSPLVVLEQPDQPGVEGYHDVDDLGRAYGRAFLSCVPGRVLLHDPSGAGASLAALIGHEALEMLLDLLANAWIDGPFVDRATGKSFAQVALEGCDPVQEQAYQVTVAGSLVDCSNFVHPAWFNKHSVGEKYDQMGALSAPFTLAPGGYAIVRGAGDEDQVFGRMRHLFRGRRAGVQKVYHERRAAEWRERMKRHAAGRTKRRLAA